MKRRKFIQSTLISAPVVATGGAIAGTRLFGEPGSVEEVANGLANSKDHLFLSLSRTGLPEKFWEKIRSITSLVNGVLRSPTESAAFSASPGSYLSKFGLDGSDAILRDETVRLLAAISDPHVRQAISQKNYKEVITYLKNSGAINFDSSNLEKSLVAVIRANESEIREIISRNPNASLDSDRETYLSILSAASPGLTEDDLAITYKLISSELEGPQLAIVLAVNALVVATVAVAAVLWIYVAGWVIGGPLDSLVSTTSFGKLAEVDPNLVKNYERVAKIAALTGEREIIEQGARDLVISECAAIVNAMRTVGIIQVSDASADRIIETLSLYAYKTVGV